jgi:hypothetical protein
MARSAISRRYRIKVGLRAKPALVSLVSLVVKYERADV